MSWIRNKTIGAKRRQPNWTLLDGSRREQLYDKKKAQFTWKALIYGLIAGLAGAVSGMYF